MLFHTVLSYNLGFLYYSDPRKVKVTQSCLTLCDSMDYTVAGILQARILEWVAISFSWDLSNPEIEPMSLMSSALQADLYHCTTWEVQCGVCIYTHTHTYIYIYVQCLTPFRRLNTIWQMCSLQTTEVYCSQFWRLGVWDQGTRMDGWRPSPRL